LLIPSYSSSVVVPTCSGGVTPITTVHRLQRTNNVTEARRPAHLDLCTNGCVRGAAGDGPHEQALIHEALHDGGELDAGEHVPSKAESTAVAAAPHEQSAVHRHARRVVVPARYGANAVNSRDAQRRRDGAVHVALLVHLYVHTEALDCDTQRHGGQRQLPLSCIATACAFERTC
jgi:hypothetical protein